MRTHFTDVVVARLRQPGTYHDDSTPAFGLRVGKHRKTWFVVRGKERLRSNIGQYPAVSLADARKEAKKLLTEEPKKGSRKTFQEAYDEFLVSTQAKKPRTQRDYKRLLSKHFLPSLARKKLPDIEYETVIECVDGVSKWEREHALAVARILFRWCVKPPRRYIPHSPLEGVQVQPSTKRKRVLKPDELKAVWHAAVEQSYPHGVIVQLLILTGQRRGEIAGLRWPWIDEVQKTITLPESITKNKKEHRFPYGDMTAAILETVPRKNTTDLLFPSAVSKDRPLSGWSKYRKGLKDGVEQWTLHDLRRTFRTTHASIGTSPEIGERLINHASGVQTEVESIYDLYSYLPEMREATAKYEKHMSNILARAA